MTYILGVKRSGKSGFIVRVKHNNDSPVDCYVTGESEMRARLKVAKKFSKI